MGGIDARLMAAFDIDEARYHLGLAALHLFRSEAHMATMSVGFRELEGMESDIEKMNGTLDECVGVLRKAAEGEDGA